MSDTFLSSDCEERRGGGLFKAFFVKYVSLRKMQKAIAMSTAIMKSVSPAIAISDENSVGESPKMSAAWHKYRVQTSQR